MPRVNLVFLVECHLLNEVEFGFFVQFAHGEFFNLCKVPLVSKVEDAIPVVDGGIV
jgi:hypothetical protein